MHPETYYRASEFLSYQVFTSTIFSVELSLNTVIVSFIPQAMTLGLLDLYHKIKEKFRPTPCHAHYVFSLHDISRVVQGILLMSPRSRTRKMMKIKKESKCGNVWYCTVEL